jgi:polysaccharide deacetylase 2 family uncharacterized protein YibQ
MASQKRKAKGAKRQVPSRRSLVSVLLITVLLCVGGSVYLARSMNRVTRPVYEEAHPVPSDLNQEIARVDEAIYEALYQEGIPETDILFVEVKPRYENGREWEFTDIVVRVRDDGSLDRLEKVMSRAISSLEPKVRYVREVTTRGEVVCDVFALRHHSHRITLAGLKPETVTRPKDLPRIAIIIDDVGYDAETARSFIRLDIPLTLSILPKAPYAALIAKEAHESGRELILHLPMEPKGYPKLKPGPGAVLVRMPGETISGIIDDHLRRIPWVRGVNNHMGSRFTEREEGMAVVFAELRKRGLFYVDSRTTHRTVAPSLGRRMGVPVVERGVFLDNDLSSKAMRFQIERLLGMARHAGYGIGIGHPHRETLRCLRDSLERIRRDAQVVPVSEIVHLAHGEDVPGARRDKGER